MGDIRSTRLSRDAAIALLKEARGQFENGAHELYNSDDQSQRKTIAACTEIIGRVAEDVGRPWRWPHEETPVGKQEKWFAEFDFSPETLAWIGWDRDQQEAFVADFDSGMNGGGDPGYYAQQVFLLHVLNGLVEQQQKAVA